MIFTSPSQQSWTGTTSPLFLLNSRVLVLEQQSNNDDSLGNFIRDVWALRRVDPVAATNSLVWAHVYRIDFIVTYF